MIRGTPPGSYQPLTGPVVPLRRAILLTVLTGLLLAACQVDLPWLAWVALAPLTLAAAGRTVGTGLALGFVSGLLAGSALYGMATYGWLLYGMLVVYCGVHMAAFGALQAWAFGRLHPVVDLLLPAAAWTGFEYLRQRGSVSFPINLAPTQADLLPLLQVAYLLGGQAVSFLIALPAGLLARWAVAGRFPRRGALGQAALLALALLYGGLRLAGPGTPPADPAAVRVAGVQTALQNWVYELEPVSEPHRRLIRETLFTLTERAAARGAQLVVWPETALHDRVLELPELQARIGGIADRTGASILAGFFRENKLGLEHNSAVLFQPGGDLAIYDKRRTAGLAEWRITPGDRLAPLASLVGPLGVLICLESVYPQDVRALVLQGAELLLVTTNDAGFLFSPMAGFHGQRSILSAIEADRHLLHLSQAGPSLLIDPQGRQQRTQLFQAGLLEGIMERRTGLSPYHRLGDLFVLLDGLFLLGIVVAGWIRSWRAAPSLAPRG